MLSEEKLLPLVARIYDAAADANLWPAFLEDFAEAVHGTTTGLVFYDWSAPDAAIDVSSRLDPAYALQYVRHFYSVNPWTQSWKRRLNRAGADTIEASDEHVDLAVLEKTEFYNDYLLPQGDAHQMGCMLTSTGQEFSAFSCLRTRKEGPFGTAELDLLRILFPHLERAVMFRRKMAELEGRWQASLDTLDCLATGVILMDDQGRIIMANRAAQQILDQRDGLVVRNRGLDASTPSQTKELRARIVAAARTTRGKGVSAGGCLAIARPSGKRPLVVVIMPTSPQVFPREVRGPALVAFVSDPEATVHPIPGALTQLHGMTASESLLATHLMQGESLVNAAERLGVSHNTARTHLSRIYEKTSTSHQGELISLLLGEVSNLLPGKPD